MPFSYPESPHVRRHGPSGYRTYESFRPWLRDEFLFRCVYCLKREQWGLFRGLYDLDHFLPKVRFPDAALDYDNLLYACRTCDAAKRDQVVPDPCNCLLAGRVIVREDGSIEGMIADSRKLIRKLGLDDAEYCEFRRMWIDIIALARVHNPDLAQRLMKYPDHLPDLSLLTPPLNFKPDSVKQSCHARRARGELPEIY